MPHDGRALTHAEVDAIQKNIFQGCYHDDEIQRLFETIAVQRRVLGWMFGLFTKEPGRRVSTTNPITNSQLAHFKELVSMEDSGSDLP